jgi:hypothetical protein
MPKVLGSISCPTEKKGREERKEIEREREKERERERLGVNLATC